MKGCREGCRESSSVGVTRWLGLPASDQPQGSRLSALAPLWATEWGSYGHSRSQGGLGSERKATGRRGVKRGRKPPAGRPGPETRAARSHVSSQAEK